MVTTLLLIYILAACEGGNDFSDNKSTRDTGSIAFNVVWKQGLDNDTDYQTRAVICGNEPEQVARVSAAIVINETSVVKRGGPWECFDSSGTIQGVPVGSDYTLLFYGHNGIGRTTYFGARLGISVNTGINNIGTIDANQFFTEIISPRDASSNIDPDSANFSWAYALGASKYQLWISESPDFSDYLTFDTDDLFFPVPAGVLDGNTTYYWTVIPIDIDNKVGWFYEDVYSFTTGSGGGATDDNYEENDSIDAAVDLSQGMNLSSISGPGIAVFQDFDFYKIVVPYNSATIEINCNFSHVDGDIDIELFDAAGDYIDLGDQGYSGDDNEILVYAHSSDASPTTYYIKVYLYFEKLPATYDLIWDATPNVANLTGLQYSGNSSFSVSQDVLVWGQSLAINWAITNNGTMMIPVGTQVWARFYLSDNAIFTESDYSFFEGWLSPIFQDGLAPGEWIFNTSYVLLPDDSPFDSDSGIFYIGIAIDVYDDVAESNEDDNSGTGAGIDYVPVNIALFY